MSLNNLLTYELKQTAQEVQEAIDKLTRNNQPAGNILITDSKGGVVFQPQVKAGIGISIAPDTQLISLSKEVQDTLKSLGTQSEGLEKTSRKISSFSSSIISSADFNDNKSYPSAKLVYNTIKEFGVQVTTEYSIAAIKSKFENAGYKSNILYTTHLSGGDTNGPCCFMQTGDIDSENSDIQLVMFYNHNWKWIQGSIQSGKVKITSEQDYDFDNITGANSNIGSLTDLHTDIKTGIVAHNNVIGAINYVYDKILAYGVALGDVSPASMTSAFGAGETIMSILTKLNNRKAVTKLSELTDDLGVLTDKKGHTHSQYIKMPSVTDGGDKYLYLDKDGVTIRWNYVTEGGANFSDLGGNPYDNTSLSNALSAKQNKLSAGSGISIVDNIISADLTPKFIVADTLPTPSQVTQGYIYLIPNQNPVERDNKDEFITIKDVSGSSTVYHWEKIGNTAINLDDYATEDFVTKNYTPRTFTINGKTLSGTGIQLGLSDVLLVDNSKLLNSIKINGVSYTKDVDSEEIDLGNYQKPITADTELTLKKVVANKLEGNLGYLTTAPTADNTSGGLQIVVLSEEPATKYNGYLYIITAQ